MTDIYIVRHGETTANRNGLWQGATDSPLTDAGREQIKYLGKRFNMDRFDLVVSSDLGRATSTAEALGHSFEPSPLWREPDLGTWEGRTYDEVRAMSPKALAAYVRGEDVKLGGADRLSGVARRLAMAYRAAVEQVGPDGRVMIVTHGLAIAVLTGALLNTRRPNPLALPSNTGVVLLSSQEGRDRILVHNDTSHLPEPPVDFWPGTRIVFIRHGETMGNIEGRWQGQQDDGLTAEGRAQAAASVAGLPEMDVLYSSRLGRARETAAIIGASIGLEPKVVTGVEEFNFGEWEGMTSDEIKAAHPAQASRLFDDGEDIARGRTGETFAILQGRVRAAVLDLVERHPERTVGVVSHGGATRAFADHVLGLEFGARTGIASMRNTAYSRFALSDNGIRILEWNIASHLER